MLAPGLLGGRTNFGERYCGYPVMVRGVYEWPGSSNLDELNAIMTRHLMIRRLKKDVLKELPPKLRQQILVEMDPHHTPVGLDSEP